MKKNKISSKESRKIGRVLSLFIYLFITYKYLSANIGRKIVQDIEQFFAARSKYPTRPLQLEMSGKKRCFLMFQIQPISATTVVLL